MVDKPLYMQESGSLRAVNEQYPLVDGTRGFTGVVSGVTPTADAHLATKQYVDLNSGDAGTISTDTTFHISTTGSDSTGDGSSGSPWATITKALEYLQGNWIAPDATVTIQLADGNHSYSDTINFNHPCGDRISIVGTTLVELSLSSVGTISGTAPDRTIVLNVDSTTNCTAGDLIRIVPTSGGTNRQLLAGASKIVSVNSSTQLTVEWPQQTTSYTPSGSIVGDITVFKTKLSHASHGIVVIGTLGNLNTLAFESTGADTYTLWVSNGASIFCGSDIIMYKTYMGVRCSSRSFVFADGITIGKCTYGLYALAAGVIRARGCIINGMSSFGIYVNQTSSYIDAEDGMVVGGASYGVYIQQNSSCRFGSGEIYACWRGLVVTINSMVEATDATLSLMDNISVYALHMSVIRASGANIKYGGYTGAYASRQSYIDVGDSVIQYNDRGIYAADNSYVRALSATVNNNTTSNYSPTSRTVGNNESYILG